MSTPPDLTEAQLVTLARALDTMFATEDRLAALTDKALIEECLASPAADHLIVIELMNRVMPGWEKTFAEEEPL